MSGISSLASANAYPLQTLQQLNPQSGAAAGGRAGQARPNGGEPPPGLWEDVESSAIDAGLTDEEVDELKVNLKEAIADALESVDRSAGAEAGHEAIDGAILSTLQEYGIDTTELETRMQEAHSHARAGGPPPNRGGAQGGGGSLASVTSATGEQDQASTLLSMLFPLVDEEA